MRSRSADISFAVAIFKSPFDQRSFNLGTGNAEVPTQ